MFVHVVCLSPLVVPYTAPPRFLVYLDSTAAEVGSQARFYCRAYACPVPEIFWYKQGRIVKCDEQFEVTCCREGQKTESMLVVLNVTHESAGTYQAKAQNKLGTDYCEADLTVISCESRYLII